jgi:hypothetical protein
MLRRALVLAIGLVGITALLSAQEMPEQFTGNVINMQGGGTVRIIVHIDSYSPDEEVLGLARVLADKGLPGLQEAIFDIKERGWIRIGPSMGYPIAVFRSRPTEKGRLVVALTDRTIQFWEAHNATRSRDYAFGMVMLDLDKDGKGEGKLLPAVRPRITEQGAVEFESMGTDPFKIIRVYQEMPKKKK